MSEIGRRMRSQKKAGQQCLSTVNGSLRESNPSLQIEKQLIVQCYGPFCLFMRYPGDGKINGLATSRHCSW